MTITPDELRRRVRRELIVAGVASLIAIWTGSLLLAARLDFIFDLTADRFVVGVSIVVCLGCVYWWAAGPRGMMRDRYFVLVPMFLAAGPAIYALDDLGAGLIAVA